MKKILWGALALFALVAGLSRFAPTLRSRAIEKCEETMSGARRERGFEGRRQEPTPLIAR